MTNKGKQMKKRMFNNYKIYSISFLILFLILNCTDSRTLAFNTNTGKILTKENKNKVMKTIFLVRHAQAVDKNEIPSDFDRSLTQNGIKDAETMAKRLKEANIIPDLFISSPAKRAIETANIFAKELNYLQKNTVLKNIIYEKSSVESLLNMLQEVDDKYSTIILFGHDPTISLLAQFLIKGFQKNIPKCGVVGIGFKKDSWREIKRAEGKLKLFESPNKKRGKRNNEIL